jgi:hypothetical protein
MLYDAPVDTWFGGIFYPTRCTPHGLYRPEVGAWVGEKGDLLAMIAKWPGRGPDALEQALQVALRRHCLPRPARLAVADADMRERLSRHTDLPIETRGHGCFDSVVGAALERIAGHRAPSRHAERAVSHALARALFLGSAAASLSARVALGAGVVPA